MKILQIHFLKSFLRNFGLVLAVLLVANTLFTVLNTLGGESGPVQTGLHYWAKLVLIAVESILPLSFLVAALFTLAPMSHFNELSAIGSSGQSIFQIIWPAMVVSVLGVLFSGVLRYFGVVGDPGSLGVGQPWAITTPEQATAFHSNFANPWANLLAFLGGVFMAGSARRRSIFSGFMGAVAGLFLYYTVSSFACSFGNKGLFHPMLAGWSGTVVFSILLFWQWCKMVHK